MSPINQQEISIDSDLRRLDRKICIVTTASLPWRTGTSVNPLARALYLTRGRPKNSVTLVIPWLSNVEEQARLFGAENTFEEPEHQEKWIRSYCNDRMHCEKEARNLCIRFYPAFYHTLFGSIFPTIDICALIPQDEADVAILEEPEHLLWFRAPPETEGLDEKRKEEALLGWQHKFKHVVGILHTNYESYMKQYGMGSEFIATPALLSLSSVVVRAYCHRVIRLSAALPELDNRREKTSNIHGVRSEFFDSGEKYTPSTTPSPIYFIGKIIWAKGFDKILDVEEAFRKRNGKYFPIDIYGKGSDEEEDSIKRAMFGREGITDCPSVEKEDINESPTDTNMIQFFGTSGSLRNQLDSGPESMNLEQRSSTSKSLNPDALKILGEISGQTVATGRTATTAVSKLCEKAMDLSFHCTFTREINEESPSGSGDYRFDLPKSKYELRQHSIPARFLGMIDHAVIKNISDHKIFLNLSETEVLCTTTAEALAMEKFVIIPNHASNNFFSAFPNCLLFSSQEECVEKINWALLNDPLPLSQAHKTMLRWEGANERLFQAAAMTKSELEERKASGQVKSDQDIARLHMQSVQKWHFIQNMVVNTIKF